MRKYKILSLVAVLVTSLLLGGALGWAGQEQTKFRREGKKGNE